MKKSLAAFVALFAAGCITGPAVAAPTLLYRVYEDNVLQTSLSAKSLTGSLVRSGSTAHFDVITAVAVGAPALAQPSLVAQTTNISSSSNFGTGPHTLRLEITQTGLDSQSAGGLFANLASSLTANILVNNGAVGSLTIANYADALNRSFSRATLLASQTFTGAGFNASPVITKALSLSRPLFSETIVITAEFLGGGAAVNASSQIAVPEPASFALFGSFILGLALLGRRKHAGMLSSWWTGAAASGRMRLASGAEG